jgi:hypothetical protein
MIKPLRFKLRHGNRFYTFLKSEFSVSEDLHTVRPENNDHPLKPKKVAVI